MKFFAVFAGYLTLIITFFIVLETVMRYFFSLPITGQVEITRMMLPYVFMLGFAYALLENKHIRMEMLVNKIFNEKGRIYVEGLTAFLGLVFSTFCLYSSWIYSWKSFLIRETMMAPITLPFWLLKFGITFSFILIVIAYLAIFASMISRYRKIPVN